ncbi:hypothetical protein evm_008680 [Chilo suppressalis]|nr:hypothetical protein evm_008680 [Chilo suppressalis]
MSVASARRIQTDFLAGSSPVKATKIVLFVGLAVGSIKTKKEKVATIQRMRSSQMLVVLCAAVVMVTAAKDGRRRLADPTTTEFVLEVSSEKCDVDKNDFCGTVPKTPRPAHVKPSLDGLFISHH